MVDGTPQKATLRETGSAHITSLFIDRDQSLWMATTNDGIYRMAGGRVDHFRSEGGLSSNAVTRFFEDREGNLWVATSKGLDRFRDTRIVTFSTTEGLTADLVGSVLASDDGRVWIGNNGSLDVLDGHRVASTTSQNEAVFGGGALASKVDKSTWVSRAATCRLPPVVYHLYSLAKYSCSKSSFCSI